MSDERIFEWFEAVRARPGMYIGYSPEERDKQLATLEVLVAGYSMALVAHSIIDDVQDFQREFSEYLYAKYGWSKSCGFVDAIRRAYPNPDAAWNRFWELLEEFRTQRSPSHPSKRAVL